MKLYCDPISTTVRPVLLFIAEHGLEVERAQVSLMTGENLAPAYLAINPNGIVPFLLDGELSLGESSAILKYLAEKVGSPAYPSALAARAKVNEALDWFNSHFHEYFVLFTVYPRMGIPRGMDPELAQHMLAFGAERSPRWLKVLEEHMLAGRPFVCGDEISLADYLGSIFVGLGEAMGVDLSPYPNITGWLGRMKARPAWDHVHADFNALLAARRGQAQAAA
ncbi:glutathione S-transferase family protein [Phenylobacterium sp.]|uniref:glutathione S-transferase family protein n=1 Tax=Phenylobacterium sp. TaxID=1871053 RepID=UPI0035685FD5